MSERKRESQQLYVRHLPGGGYVTIEAMPVRSFVGRNKYRGVLIVERRVEKERREGHTAPVVATAEGPTIAAVLQELFPLAQSNVAIASQVLDRGKHLAKR
jgi:hypothetical protein